MSSIIAPVAPTPAPEAVPAPAPRQVPNGGLPDSIKINKNHDATEFFKKHEEANGRVVPAAATPAAVELVAAPVAAPAAEPAAKPPEKKADLGSALADSMLPDGAKPKPDVKPTEPVAPAAENPEDKVGLDPKYSKEAHDSFKIVKGITKEVRTTLAQRDRELSEVRAENEKLKTGAVTVDSPEITQLKAEHKAMSDRLVVLDIENHPNYQREFVAPRQQAEATAKEILAAAGIEGVDIQAMLSKDPLTFRKEMSAIAAKLPSALDVQDFAQAMRTAQSLKQRAGEAAGRAGEISQALKQQTLDAQKTAFNKTYDETMGRVKISEVTAPAGSPPEVLAAFEGFNSDYRSLRQSAEKIVLGASTPKDIAQAGTEAAAFRFMTKHTIPAMSKAIAFRDARITELEQQLSGIRARSPNRDIGGLPNAGGGMDPSKMSHKEAAEYYANLK